MNVLVFVDTSFLHSISRNDDSWKKILELAKKEELLLYFPTPVQDEYLSKKRDDLEDSIREITKSVNEFNKRWNNNICHDFLPTPANVSPPSIDILDKNLKKGMDEFTKEFEIKVLSPNLEDFQKTFEAYFLWEGQFNHQSKNDRNVRNKRRMQIIDALISEMSFSFKDISKNQKIYWLTLDGKLEEVNDSSKKKTSSNEGFPKLTQVLEEKGFEVFSKAEDFLEAFRKIETFNNNLEIEDKGKSFLQQPLSPLKEEILGFLFYFDGMNKESLLNFLRPQEYKESDIEGELSALIQERFLQCTALGKYLLEGVRISIGKEAARKITPKIIKYMKDNSHE